MDRRGGALNLKFHEASKIEPARLMNLVRETRGAQFTPAGVLRIPVDGTQNAAALLGYLKEQLGQLSAV